MLITEQNHYTDLDNVFDLEIIGRVPKKGIIHIGAHQGQEVDQYLAYGFSNIALIEANPEWYQFLVDKFSHLPQVKIFNLAICERDGLIDLHIHTSRSGSTEPASILPMKRFQEIVKTLHTPETIRVSASTLDSLFIKQQLNLSDYNFVNIDIQGAEMLALRGAVNTLKSMAVVICEIAVVELYENGALEDEIVSFLKAKGFEKKKVVYHTLYDEKSTFPAWGECLFLRTN